MALSKFANFGNNQVAVPGGGSSGSNSSFTKQLALEQAQENWEAQFAKGIREYNQDRTDKFARYAVADANTAYNQKLAGELHAARMINQNLSATKNQMDITEAKKQISDRDKLTDIYNNTNTQTMDSINDLYSQAKTPAEVEDLNDVVRGAFSQGELGLNEVTNSAQFGNRVKQNAVSRGIDAGTVNQYVQDAIPNTAMSDSAKESLKVEMSTLKDDYKADTTRIEENKGIDGALWSSTPTTMKDPTSITKSIDVATGDEIDWWGGGKTEDMGASQAQKYTSKKMIEGVTGKNSKGKTITKYPTETLMRNALIQAQEAAEIYGSGTINMETVEEFLKAAMSLDSDDGRKNKSGQEDALEARMKEYNDQKSSARKKASGQRLETKFKDLGLI